MTARFGFTIVSAAALLHGCAYGFSGGGLPSEIRTVVVLPFENITADPTMATEANRTVREVVERRLGLRSVAESRADAVVTGTVVRYEPDQPVAFRGTGTGNQGRAGDVEVDRRLLQITINIEMVQQSTGRQLLRKKTFTVDQQYPPGREAEGKRLALEDIAKQIITDAQSQW